MENDDLDDLETVSLDDSPENADWIKQSGRGWDLPPYKSEEFYEVIPEAELEAFKEWLVYQHAVEIGLIVDDEWAGDN